MIQQASLNRQDEQLRRKVYIAIDRLGYPQLLQTTCQVSDGDVELHGEVESFYMKQLLQTAAFSVAGVQRVSNQVQVTACHS